MQAVLRISSLDEALDRSIAAQVVCVAVRHRGVTV